MKVALSHIALACPNLEGMLEKLKALSLSVEKIHDIPTEGVKAAMVPVLVSEKMRIELVEPTVEGSPVSKFLAKHPKGGIHHVSFEVTELEKWVAVLEKKGLEVLPPGIRKSARGRAIFLHPNSFGGLLVELEEIKTS